MMSENADKATKVRKEAEDAIKSHQSGLRRCNEAWDAYLAVDGKQWKDDKRKVLSDESREARQYDIISAKAQILVGSIISELPDCDFVPIDCAKTTGTEAIKQTYYQDKGLHDHNTVFQETILSGVIHSGWMQMTESNKFFPKRTISLSHCRDGYVIPDPYWKTDNDRECKIIYKIAYLSAEQIARIYKAKGDEIKRAMEDRKMNGAENNPGNVDDQQRQYKEHVGDEWRVIEKHYLEEINDMRLVGMKQGMESWMPFPLTKDRALLEQYAAENGIDWTSVQEQPYYDCIHKVITITDLAPDLILEDAKSSVQVKGLPFFHFTCIRHNGQDKGIAECLLDIQRTINERESYVTDMIDKASGGSEIWNKGLFRDQTEKDSFRKTKNQHGKTFFADLDDVRNVKVEVTPAQVHPAVFQQLQFMWKEMMPIIGRVGDAMSAVSASEDSGVLFEKKYQMNRIANVIIDKFARNLVKNVGEAYFYQWQITYKGVEQKVSTRSGEEELYLNKREMIGDTPVVINSVEDTPRVQVQIIENQNSSTYQIRRRIEALEIIKILAETGDYLRLNEAYKQYFESLDVSDTKKGQYDKISQMEDMKVQLQFMSEVTDLAAKTKNGEVMIAQAQQFLDQQAMQKQQMGGGVEQSIVPQEALPKQGGMPPQQSIAPPPQAPAPEPQMAMA
jgi:hypothetical protein